MHESCSSLASIHSLATGLQGSLLKLFERPSKRVLIIAGPTAVGKSALAIQIAEQIGGEIISADSIQVYRGMDIGTAKVSPEERLRVPHHLLDIRDLNEPYNVADFYKHATTLCREILARGRVPIIAGGTGFYLHALLYGAPQGPPSDPKVRKKFEEDVEKYGIEPLFQKLQELDPIYAATITVNDAHKIVRALEIIEISGRKVSSFEWKARTAEPFFDFRAWFIHRPRQELYEIVEKRCDAMLEAGFLKEVVHLDRLGIRQNSTACQAIGYKQCLDFLETAQTCDDYTRFVEQFKIASRHLVKRQFTWFRKEPLFRWMDRAQYTLEEMQEMIISDFQQDAPPVAES